MIHAALWALASLVTAAAILGLTFLVWVRNEGEAGRMMIEAQKGTAYIKTVVSGLAANPGRPGNF